MFKDNKTVQTSLAFIISFKFSNEGNCYCIKENKLSKLKKGNNRETKLKRVWHTLVIVRANFKKLHLSSLLPT